MEKMEMLRNEAGICPMRILQSRNAAGSVQTRCSPHSYRGQRVHFLLRKMCPKIPTEKEKVMQVQEDSPFFYF
jgi:hypothetical protein